MKITPKVFFPRFVEQLYVEGLLFSRSWVCRPCLFISLFIQLLFICLCIVYLHMYIRFGHIDEHLCKHFYGHCSEHLYEHLCLVGNPRHEFVQMGGANPPRFFQILRKHLRKDVCRGQHVRNICINLYMTRFIYRVVLKCTGRTGNAHQVIGGDVVASSWYVYILT